MKNFLIFIFTIIGAQMGLSQDIYITTQSDLNTYQGTPKFYQTVRITTTVGQDSSTMITDLSPLMNVDSFLYDLRIYNTALTSLYGLQNAEFIDNLYIYDNNLLVDASELKGPYSAETIIFESNPNLKILPDFGFLESPSDIYILSNSHLEIVDIDLKNAGFDPAVNYSRTKVNVVGNNNLTEVLINDPNEVVSGIGIDSNQILTKVHFSHSNDSLNSVIIKDNPELNHISGFQDVKYYGFVPIKGNPNLSELCFLQNAIQDSLVGLVQLDGNATGANSESEIMATDCSDFNTGINEINDSKLSLYPNPAHKEVFVEMPDKTTPYQIYDMSGKVVKQGNIETNGRIGLSAVSGGMYILLIGDKRSKLVIQ